MPALKVSSRNPRYFEDADGKTILLAGSHHWANFKDFESESDHPGKLPFDYEKYLDFMQSQRMNFFRLWTWDFPRSPMRLDVYAMVTWNRSPHPWPRTGPGNANDGLPKFDLHQFDESYFARLRERVVAAGKRGIYVAIMLFGGVEHFTARQGPTGFPFDRSNNINGVRCGHLRSQTIMAETLPLQDAYVRRVIDTVNDLDNVMYEISNEGGSHTIEWQLHFIELIKAYQAGLPNQHPVGITNITDVDDEVLMSSNADWVSPSGADGFGFPSNPASATGSKVMLNDTDHSAFYPTLQKVGHEGQRDWAWKNFTRGYNLAFMDPYLMPWPGRNQTDGYVLDPYWSTIRNSLAYTRDVAARLDLGAVRPAGHLASSTYCLANPGGADASFVAYFAGQTELTLDLTTVDGDLAVDWLDIVTGTFRNAGRCSGGTRQQFVQEQPDEAILFLHR